MKPQLLLQTRKFLSMAQMFTGVNDFNIIAGPCSVENEKQMEDVAQVLKQNNIKFMRGGAYKPRTSPHTFQGLGLEGLQLLKNVCEKYSLFGVSEILDPRVIEDSLQYIDIIQIGSRSMQNTTLLKEIGKTNHPVIN